MDIRINFEQIKPEYLEYIDICKEKALNDEEYYSKLIHEMSKGYIDYFIQNKENINDDIKIHDLLEYQVKLIESMNFNNDIIVKRLNKIFNILVKEKHKNDINNLNNQPSVYLLTKSNTDFSQHSDDHTDEQGDEQDNDKVISHNNVHSDEQDNLQHNDVNGDEQDNLQHNDVNGDEQSDSQHDEQSDSQHDEQSDSQHDEQSDSQPPIYYYHTANQTQSKFHYRKINRNEVQSEPNKFIQSEPNKFIQSEPNKFIQSEPNKLVQSEPNKLVQSEPNKFIQSEIEIETK